MSRIAALCLVALVPSCVTQHHVRVTGTEIAAQAPTLRAQGRAQVSMEDTHGDDRTWHVTQELRLDQTIGASDEPYVVRDLIRDCGAGRLPDRPCALDELTNVLISVRRYETRSVKPILKGVVYGLITGAVVAAVTCGIACDEGSDARQVSKITIGVVSVAVVGSLAWVLISCASGRSCHD